MNMIRLDGSLKIVLLQHFSTFLSLNLFLFSPTLFKVWSKNSAELVRRKQDLSELISAFFTPSSFYCPSNGLFITFILYSAAPVWPHYDYSTALEFQDNYELHCFNKSVGQHGSLLHLHSSQREIFEGSGGQMQVNIYPLQHEEGCCRLIKPLVKRE